jgi:hypothetical protein
MNSISMRVKPFCRRSSFDTAVNVTDDPQVLQVDVRIWSLDLQISALSCRFNGLPFMTLKNPGYPWRPGLYRRTFP